MLRSAHCVSDSHSAVANVGVASLLLILIFPAVLAPQLAATVIVSTDIHASNIGITPSSGMVVFQQPWTAEAYAQAQNSLGEFDAHFDTSIGGVAQASAMVAFAGAEAEAMAPIPNENFAHSDINIPNITAAASSLGRGTLFNTTFMITGGSGPVTVNFSVPLTTMQSLFTDDTGLLATSEVVYGLTLDGTLISFLDIPLQIGPDSSLMLNSSQTLMGTATLNFGQAYTLYEEVDSESSGINVVPEPPTVLLTLLGASTLLIRRVCPAVSARIAAFAAAMATVPGPGP